MELVTRGDKLPAIPEWHESAKCRFHRRLFQELIGAELRQGDPKVIEAISICNTCSAKRNCLQFALSLPPTGIFGIWGGKTPYGLRTYKSKHDVPTIKRKRVRGERAAV